MEQTQKYVATKMYHGVSAVSNMELDFLSSLFKKPWTTVVSIIGQYQSVDKIGDIVVMPVDCVEAYVGSRNAFTQRKAPRENIYEMNGNTQKYRKTKPNAKKRSNNNVKRNVGNQRNFNNVVVRSNPYQGLLNQMKNMQIREKKQSKLQRAISIYMNPFKNETFRVPFAHSTNTAIFKKMGICTLSTDAAGKLAVRCQYDPDVSLVVSFDNTSPAHASSSNIYTPAMTIGSKGASNVFTVTCAVRFKYIGPLLNRGGIAYIMDGTHLQVGGNISTIDAPYHLHGQVHVIEDGWYWWRPKLTGGQTTITETVESSGYPLEGYAYFEGLPASTACIMAEAVLVQEFVPTVDENLYVQTSSENRLNTIEYNTLIEKTCVPKFDQLVHKAVNGDQEEAVAEHVHKSSWMEKLKGFASGVFHKAVSYEKEAVSTLISAVIGRATGGANLALQNFGNSNNSTSGRGYNNGAIEEQHRRIMYGID